MSDMPIRDFMTLDAALGSEKVIEEQGTSMIPQISADTPITAQITEGTSTIPQISADTPTTAQITEGTFNTHSKVKRSEIEDFTALDAALGGIQGNPSSNIEATPVNLNMPSFEQEIGEKEKEKEKEKGIPVSGSNLVTPLSIKKSEIETFAALDAALGAISKEKEDTEPTGKLNDEALFLGGDDEVEVSAPEVRDDEALFLGEDDEVELPSSTPTSVANSNQGASEATVTKNEPIPTSVPDAEDNRSQKGTELASDKREPSKKIVLSGQTALDRAFSAIQQGVEPEWTPATEFDNLLAACLVKKKGTSEGLNSSLALIEMPELDSVPIKSRISASKTAFASFRQLMELSSNPNVTDDSAIAWLFALAAASSGTSITEGDYKAAYHAVLDSEKNFDEFDIFWQSPEVQSRLVESAIDNPYQVLKQVYANCIQRTVPPVGVFAPASDDIYFETVSAITSSSAVMGKTDFTAIIRELFIEGKKSSLWNTSEMLFKSNTTFEKNFHRICMSGCIPDIYEKVVYSKKFTKLRAGTFIGKTNEDMIVMDRRLKNLLKSLFYTFCYTSLNNADGLAALKSIKNSTGIPKPLEDVINAFQDKLLEFYILLEAPSEQGVLEIQYCMPSRVSKEDSNVVTNTRAEKIIDTLKNNISLVNKSDSSKLAYRGLRELYFGKSYGITYSSTVSYRVYSIIATLDAKFYALAPNFAYKPIKAYIAQGKAFDYHNVLIGKSLANTDVFLNLGKYKAISLYAASRSGKGVMTLSILCSLLASKNVFFTYGDFKPEMSTVFWNLTKSYRQKFPGLDTKFLSCEFRTDPATAGEANSNMKYYTAAGFSSVPYKKSWTSPQLNPSMTKFKEYFSLTDNEFNTLTSAKYNLFGVLGYMKYIQLLFFCVNSSPNWGDADLIGVLDEYTALSGCNKFLYTPEGVLFTIRKRMSDKLKVLQSQIDSLTKKGEDASEKQAEKNELEAKIETWGIYFVPLPGTKYLTGTTSLFKAIEDRTRQYNDTVPHLHFFIIGQEYRKDIYSVPQGVKTADKESPSEDFFTGFNRVFLRTSSCLRLQGNIPSGHSEDIEDLQSDASFWNSPDVQASLVGYDDKSYIHEDGTVAPSGYWYVKGMKDDTLPAVCKSYMILNENDYGTSGGYVDGMIKRLKAEDTALADRVLKQEILNENKPVPEVGFEALATYVGTQGNSENTESLKAFVENYGAGYKHLWEIFSASPICSKFGYTSLEDFIYDFDPEHFVADIFEAPMISASAPAPVSADDPTQNSFSNTFGTTPLQEVPRWQEDAFSSEFSEPSPIDNSGTPEPSPISDNKAPVPDNNAPEPSPIDNSGTPAAGQAYSAPPQPASPLGQTYSAPAQPAPAQPAPAQPAPLQPADRPDMSSTQTMTAFTPAFDQELPVQMGDNPFAIYTKNGTVSNSLLRESFTGILFQYIARAFGGLDAITEFTIQNNVVILNKTPFTPKLPEDIVATAPFAVQEQLAQGEFAQVFHFSYLKKLKNLLSISIDNQSLVDGFFWSDTIIQPYKINKIRKHWKKLQRFIVSGTDYIAKLSEDEMQCSQAEQQAILEKRQADLDNFSRLKDTGRNVAGAFATAIGLEPSSADRHPILQRIGKSRPMKALRKGIGFTAAAYGASLLISIANPFLLLGGLFAAGSYIASRNSHKSE